MKVVVDPFSGNDSVKYTVDVIDTMKDGIAVVAIVDGMGGILFDTSHYCTIIDITKPAITASHNFARLHIVDSGAWQRGIDTIFVTDTANIVVSPSMSVSGKCLPSVDLSIGYHDLLVPSHAIVHVRDCAGNDTAYPVFFVPGSDAVGEGGSPSALRVYPNPSSDAFTIELPDEPTSVEIFDALGRKVADFRGPGTALFDATALPAGSYLLRIANESLRIMKK
jgi:hypothetical protein